MNSDRALLIATKIAVRYVAWPVTLAMITVTILKTHFWLDLLFYSLVLTLGEVEYWLLHTEPAPDDEHTAKV